MNVLWVACKYKNLASNTEVNRDSNDGAKVVAWEDISDPNDYFNSKRLKVGE